MRRASPELRCRDDAIDWGSPNAPSKLAQVKSAAVGGEVALRAIRGAPVLTRLVSVNPIYASFDAEEQVGVHTSTRRTHASFRDSREACDFRKSRR